MDAKVLQLALEANAKLQQSNAPPAYAVAPVFSPRVGSEVDPIEFFFLFFVVFFCFLYFFNFFLFFFLKKI